MPGLRGSNRTRSVCEVLRLINDAVQDNTEKDQKVRELVAEAMNYTKRMAKKLWEYHNEYGIDRYDKGWFDTNAYMTEKEAEEMEKRRQDPNYKIGTFESNE